MWHHISSRYFILTPLVKIIMTQTSLKTVSMPTHWLLLWQVASKRSLTAQNWEILHQSLLSSDSVDKQKMSSKDVLTDGEMAAVTTVFRQYETGLREAAISAKGKRFLAFLLQNLLLRKNIRISSFVF